MQLSDADLARVVCEALYPGSSPEVVAVYVFGSSARGESRRESDLDIAFLSQRSIDPARVFDAAQAVATKLGRDVDLVDLSRASTVMRVQVIGTGRVIYVGDRYRTDLFEMYALSDYARLQEERAESVRAFTARYDD